MASPLRILAPLRGVTIRAFRQAFARPIAEAGFTEAITPFIAANAGVDPLKDRELRGREEGEGDNGIVNFPRERESGVRGSNVSPLVQDAKIPLSPYPSSLPLTLTPQFIGKDPVALRHCLERVKGAGYRTADLNAGCPYPMVRNKGRGSGLLRTPDVLMRLLETGCEVMGPGNFSLKTRLGFDRTDELLALMPRINGFPLRYLTVHARTARQMYEGACDRAALAAVRAAARVPFVENGDVPFPIPADAPNVMVGRSFVRALGARDDIGDLLADYLALSRAELFGDAPVLGRFKELLAYWKDLPAWRRRWPLVKIARTLDELRVLLP